MKFSTVIHIIFISIILFAFSHSEGFAQRTRTVRVRKETTGPHTEEFGIKKGKKNNNGKVTRKGRRFSNYNEIMASISTNKKRQKEIKKKQRDPHYYSKDLVWKDKSKDTRKIKKDAVKQTHEMRKQARKDKKSRKNTIRTNKKIMREQSVSRFRRFYTNTWYYTKRAFSFNFLKSKKHKGKSKKKG